MTIGHVFHSASKSKQINCTLIQWREQEFGEMVGRGGLLSNNIYNII